MSVMIIVNDYDEVIIDYYEVWWLIIMKFSIYYEEVLYPLQGVYHLEFN